MKKLELIMLLMAFFALAPFAQASVEMSYEKAFNAPAIQWVCPEVEKYQGIIASLRNDDYKIWANDLMESFEPYTNPLDSNDKYLITQGVLTIENPYYYAENLLNYIASWIKNNRTYNVFAKSLSIDNDKKMITTTGSVQIARNASLLEVYKIYITPLLIIHIMEDNKLLVSFSINSYNNEVYDANNRHTETKKAKVSEVYPLGSKSTYKNSYARAYVASYSYFWSFISELRDDLNVHFTRDNKMLSQLHYKYTSDSIKSLYGEPTKVIADELNTSDINKEIRVYEEAQKIIFMGKSVDFKDIISCEIKDDPKIIPGSSTSLGAGISIFGIGLSGGNTYRTPDKTIHNYVVSINIDSLKNPLILIATGQNEFKAREIVSVIEYIMRHR